MSISMTRPGLRQQGFTLIEIAIVVLVVGILLGYTVALFPVQQDLKRSRQVDRELDQIIEQLVAFAQVNGRLPCPDSSAGAGVIDGVEDKLVDDCEAFFGFLPARTIGMNGRFNAQGVLVDPWGTGYRYAVSDFDVAPADGKIELVSPNGIRNAGIAAVQPDLFVCDGSAVVGNNLDCTTVTGARVVGNVAAVIISLGKDAGNIASNIQTENTDDFHDGANDKVYIFSTRSEVAGAEFDDVIKWIPSNQLFSKMIEAGQLP
jgi:prepilin-type N-terminal cleavage/methylation domain-containing protein